MGYTTTVTSDGTCCCSGPDPCCRPSTSVTLYGSITSTECACLNGLVIPMPYDPTMDLWYSGVVTIPPDCCVGSGSGSSGSVFEFCQFAFCLKADCRIPAEGQPKEWVIGADFGTVDSMDFFCPQLSPGPAGPNDSFVCDPFTVIWLALGVFCDNSATVKHYTLTLTE